MTSLNISEFYTSIQGEGTLSGRPSIIIRFSGCNCHCSWCDTPHQDPDHSITLEDISNLCRNYPDHDIIITGGEPLLKQQEILKIVRAIRGLDGEMFHHITIETNGTINPAPHLRPDLWSVSPKLTSSGEKYKPLVIETFALRNNTQFKFVISEDSKDLQDFISICHTLHPSTPIIVQPVAHPTDNVNSYLHRFRRLTETILDLELHNNIRILPQLHKLLWGFNTDGV